MNNAFLTAPLTGAVISKAAYMRSLPPKLQALNPASKTNVRVYEYTTVCPYFKTQTTRRITWTWLWHQGSLSGEWKQVVEVLGGVSTQ